MILDFILSEHELGNEHGRSRALCPRSLCDNPRGLSGSEVNALGLATALVGQGCDVRVYTLLQGLESFMNEDGVFFYDLRSKSPDGKADIAVAFHDGRPLSWWPAKKRIAWHQTITPPFYEMMPKENVDLYISATAHNAAHLRQYTGSKPWQVIPNGWDYGDYPYPAPIPGRLFYHTSPERGLHILLRALPAIKELAPETHLEIWCRLGDVKKFRPHIWAEIEEGLSVCKDYATLHGEGYSRNMVLAELSKAQVVAYPSEPSTPCEVMPVSLMEACALGIPVMTAPSDGFEKAFCQAISYSPWPPSRYLQAFIQGVAILLHEHDTRLKAGMAAREWASEYTFAQTSQRFLHIAGGLLYA